jgi:hypothetical protein
MGRQTPGPLEQRQALRPGDRSLPQGRQGDTVEAIAPDAAMQLAEGNEKQPMTFRSGVSGNPAGGKKGPRSLAVRIRAMAEKDAIEIVKAVIEGARLGDVECRRLYLKHLLPLPRVISTPVELPLAQSASEAQEQIAMLTTMAARGDLDIDALPILTRSLTLAIDTRLTQLEEIIETREGEAEAV